MALLRDFIRHVFDAVLGTACCLGRSHRYPIFIVEPVIQ